MGDQMMPELDRFLTAQEHIYPTALDELRAGRKRTHWMWFVFPQLAGLGSSAMAVRFAITSRAEAQAYLAHPVLGARLVECAEALLVHEGRSAESMLGAVDAMKLRSSMTLFAAVGPPGSVFERVLAAFFSGRQDERTVELLGM